MRNIHCLILALLFFPSLFGCTTEVEHSTPDDALFCDNIADQVQSVEQLHIATSVSALTDASTHIQYDTTYAMWFSAMDYADTLRGKSENEFRTEMQTRFQNAAELGINTVFLHVRAYQDAYYPSELFPMGAYADPDLNFDPLAIMLEEAHALGLSAHAWVNPLRGPGTKALDEMNRSYQIKKWYDNPDTNGTYLVQVGGNWWLNPAYPEVRQLAADGIAEILTQYDVDGIHIDDYFYPTTDADFDSAAFQASGETDLAAFRLSQTNEMVKLMYDTTKSIDSGCMFSISPQGTMQGNYDQQFADVKRWASEPGYCDMIIPQIYYGFENETAPFSDTVSIWAEATSCEAVSLVVGICTYKIGEEDIWAGTGSDEWIKNLDIPQQQVAFLLEQDSVDGVAIYDYDATFCPDTAKDAIAEQTAAIRSLLRS